jgi:hypothetical protein
MRIPSCPQRSAQHPRTQQASWPAFFLSYFFIVNPGADLLTSEWSALVAWAHRHKPSSRCKIENGKHDCRKDEQDWRDDRQGRFLRPRCGRATRGQREIRSSTVLGSFSTCNGQLAALPASLAAERQPTCGKSQIAFRRAKYESRQLPWQLVPRSRAECAGLQRHRDECRTSKQHIDADQQTDGPGR